MEKTSNEELTESKRLILRRSMEEIKADASETITRIHQLIHKHFDSVEDNIDKRTRELELKENELQSLKSDLDKRSKKFEEEITKAGDLKKLAEECTEELRSKRNELTAKLDTSARIQREIELKSKHLGQVRAEHRRIYSEARKVQERKKEMEDETARKTKDLGLILDKIVESNKKLATVNEQIECQGRLLESKTLELVSKEKELGYVQESIKLSNADLDLKEKMVQSLNNQITVCGKTIGSKANELGQIQKLIEQQTNELELKNEQLKQIMAEHQRIYNETRKVQEQLDLKSKELGEIQRELELKKQLQQKITMLVGDEKQPAAAPNNDTSERNAAETESVHEGGLMDYGFSDSLTPFEVSSALRALPNAAETVLDLVQGDISAEYELQDSLLKNLVLIFDELTKVQRSVDPQLEPKATQVATLWKGKITIEAPKSSLEALAFLLFIVAYGLKKLINEEETALLASSIAHYEQAPRLCSSLNLNPVIRETVKKLIKKSQYITAVRLICLFKLNDEFSTSLLLMEEISNLKLSVFGKKPVKSCQAKDKDARRLRAILELVADYNLEINIPGDLIAKLMIHRESSTPMKHRTSSSTPQS